jgi:hypothetical protein
MKLSIWKASGAGAATALLAVSVAFAAGIGTGIPRIHAASGGATSAPLKGAIRLNPAMQGSMVAGYARRWMTIGEIDRKESEFTNATGGYESGLKHRLRAVQECSTKSYSVQDQIAAGCSGSEPLSQCMDKLYRHCLATTIQHDGGATKNFPQSAAAAAARARALSEALIRYATEAEQNAKRFVQ